MSKFIFQNIHSSPTRKEIVKNNRIKNINHIDEDTNELPAPTEFQSEETVKEEYYWNNQSSQLEIQMLKMS